jgi:hypothetical protein
MADPRSGIPADGISFEQAFELVFDAKHPQMPGQGYVRCRYDSPDEGSDRFVSFDVDSRSPEDDDRCIDEEAALREVDEFFRAELAQGRLVAYQRFANGDERVDTAYWDILALVWGYADESPPIFFRQAEFDTWMKDLQGISRKSNAGRKPQYDPAKIRDFVFDRMDHHGDFTPDDPVWDCQAKLERAISGHLNNKAAESTVRHFARRFHDEWKALRGR